MATRDVRVKRFWFDPRFAIGVALILVSIGGTALVVNAADTSIEVYLARGVLTNGQTIGENDLILAHVALESASDLYLRPDDIDGSPFIMNRTVAEGELVPISALGAAAGNDFTTVVVAVSGRLAGSIGEGATADLWASSELEGGQFGAPVVIVPEATVIRIVEPEGLVVNDSSGSVELLVPHDTVARLLEAIANDDALSLVPASLPARG